jgi:transposase-like protein
MNIREAHEKFATDEQCLQYIGTMRWPNGIVRCPECGGKDVKRVDRKADSKNRRKWFYLCLEKSCHNQFTPTSGTIFHDTHLPLIVWFQAITLMLNAKKGLSAKQMQRDLGIGGYKTAWYLNHRIRKAMAEGAIPQLGGIVEIDETYVGGKTIRKKDRGNRRWEVKEAVVGMIQRGGELHLRHIGKGSATSKKVAPLVRELVSRDVERVMTDESIIYPVALDGYCASKHETIQHKTEYVRGDVHTNTIESAFSLFKRGVMGSFHFVSIKHLQRYLDEFAYRFNRRKDDGAFMETVRRMAGFAPLTFDALTSEKA